MGRFIYRVKDTVLGTHSEFNTWSDYFTSEAKARKLIKIVLEDNKGRIDEVVGTNGNRVTPPNGINLTKITYTGGNGKYKAQIILTKIELK